MGKGLISISSNASAISRDVTKAAETTVKEASKAVTKIVWREFERLVIQTPQYSGTTAASWVIQMGPMKKGAGAGTVNTRPKPKSVNEAFQQGAGVAVAMSVDANKGALDNFLVDNRNKDILIYNYAPGAVPSEEGTFLREVNDPGKMLARFEARLQARLSQVIKPKTIKV